DLGRFAEITGRQVADVAREIAAIRQVLYLQVERDAIAAGARRAALRRGQRAAVGAEVDAAGHLHGLAERARVGEEGVRVPLGGGARRVAADVLRAIGE